jgi:hypothetical protein
MLLSMPFRESIEIVTRNSTDPAIPCRGKVTTGNGTANRAFADTNCLCRVPRGHRPGIRVTGEGFWMSWFHRSSAHHRTELFVGLNETRGTPRKGRDRARKYGI